MEKLTSFITNFDFEDSLKLEVFKKAELNEINQSLEFLFFWYCNENEQVISRRKYEKSYLKYIENLRDLNLHYSNKITPHLKTWWGKLDGPEDWIKEREINSNITAHLIREELGLNVLEGSECRDAEGFELVESQFDGPLVYKEEFGFSGRGLHFKWDEKSSYPIIIEPYVQRVRDFGIRVSKSNHSVIQNLISTKGSYKGSFMKDHFEETEELLIPAKKIYESYREKFGVDEIQIDSYQYLVEGVLKLNPFCEVNHRKSMGLIATSLHEDFGNNVSLVALVHKKMMRRFESFSLSLESLKSLDYNPVTKKGVIRLSPAEGAFSLFFLTEDSERTLQHLIKDWWISQSQPGSRLPSEFIIYF